MHINENVLPGCRYLFRCMHPMHPIHPRWWLKFG